jgi:DNA-binding FrmR family transcriptional regulator
MKEEEKKNLLKKLKDIRAHVRGMVDDLEETPERLRRTIEVIQRGEAQAEQAKKELVEANLDSSSRSRRNIRTAGCSSST